MIAKNGMKVGAVLDLGGGATKERISEAMRILFSTPGVKAVLINIFGGITRCDEVAGGVRLAMEHHSLDGKLIVVRMEGTNKDKGVEILAKPEDEPVWQEKAMGVWPQFYDKIGDISLLDTMMKSLGRTRPQ